MPDLEQRAIALLLCTPISGTYAGRSALLIGLPNQLIEALDRDDDPYADLAGIIKQLSELGPLAGGVRPVLVVLAAGQRRCLGTALEREFASTIVDLERAYGREEATPALDAAAGPSGLSNNELLVFGVDHRLPFCFIEGAYRAGHALARLEISLGARVGYGTAWLCGRDLLMTNCHVVSGGVRATAAQLRENARHIVAWFDYRLEGGTYVSAVPTGLRWFDESLDCAILELQPGSTQGRVPFRIARGPAQVMRGARLNIPQHPRGGPIRFAIRSNYYAGDGEDRSVIRYVTDTEKGSSGSPVCDDSWAVVALHARSAAIAPRAMVEGTAHYLNEGIAIGRILDALPSNLAAQVNHASQ